ncbi:FAD-binding oxidoreductase [Nocardia miyunensis]|uniref:FAD-binding oxidoreductase n=1 Tax=Nocardia miyunensis TaxID=282684 RepID=UPI000A98CDFD|nr:FAD-binding oxidoreductase [Nocardia miyunensis]
MISNDGGPVRRRALLRGVGALTAATTLTRSGTSTAAPLDWGVLRKRLQTKLLLPADGEYASAKQLFDPQFDTDSPLAVVRATTANDVAAAVAFARDNRLPLAARAGGHSYVGASATTGTVVVDVRGLDDITLTGDLVTVGAGATIRTVLAELAESGRSLPVGSCPSVGLAGLTLGGGLGVDSRRYGLTCDALESADVVLPGGGTAHASADQLPGLFWALRGGGGSAGILTSLTFRTHAAQDRDIVRLRFPTEAAARVLTGWARWLPTADRSVWSNVEIGTAAGTVECSVLMVTPAGQGAAAAAGLTAAAATTPASVTRRTLGHLAAADDIAGGSTIPRSTKIAGSDIVRELDAAVAGTIVDIVTARSRSGATGYVLVDPLDGAVRDIRADACAFPWRAHAATLQWIVDEPDSPEDARAWITGAHRTLGAASAGAYANYTEPGVTADRYYVGNVARLRTLARFIDPNRLLRTGITL